MSLSVPHGIAVPALAIPAMIKAAPACALTTPFTAMVLLYAGATIATIFLVMAGHPDAVGYLASLFVLSSFASRSMLWLRVMALLSNAAFMLYAYDSHLPPVLFLHALLLPVNLVRLWQHSRATPGSA